MSLSFAYLKRDSQETRGYIPQLLLPVKVHLRGQRLYASTPLTFKGTVKRPEAISLSSWPSSPLRKLTSQPSQRSTTFRSFVHTCGNGKLFKFVHTCGDGKLFKFVHTCGNGSLFRFV
jgi:hypothetical protein